MVVDEDVGTLEVCLALIIDEGTGIANVITVVPVVGPGLPYDVL